MSLRRGILPFLASGALLAGLAARIAAYPTPADAEPFHARAAARILAIPAEINGWSGVDTPLPPAAQQLLKPNASLARLYRRDGQRDTSLLIVQCRDSRDMAGHYPPVCYPAHGWVKRGEPTRIEHRLGDRTVPIAVYQFGRSEFASDRSITVLGFFALPGRGFTPSMDDVHDAAADYTARAFGAAQIQLVFPGPFDPAVADRALDDLLAPHAGLLESLAHPERSVP